MDEYEIRIFQRRPQFLRVPGVCFLIDLELAFAKRDSVALERVVDALGALEEVALAFDNAP